MTVKGTLSDFSGTLLRMEPAGEQPSGLRPVLRLVG